MAMPLSPHWFVVAVAALALGCSSSAHSTASRPISYAQATCMDTETCCLQRHPGNPEACGLSAAEAAVLMAGAKAATESVSEEWDDSHNAHLPEWKRRCIRSYGDCRDGLFNGPCYDCLRRCEGQQEWPLDMCEPRKPRRR
jgi:hypothetical protein